jgi:hypothetical protein
MNEIVEDSLDVQILKRFNTNAFFARIKLRTYSSTLLEYCQL